MSQLPRKQTAISTVGGVGQLREVYAENWKCSDCEQENYASRPKCIRCKKPRPENILLNATAASGASLNAPPCDWFEAVDPNSRQIYYYNNKTGETQWDRPAELGPAPYATGWIGRGGGSLSTSKLYTKLNSLYLSRPAKPQKSKEETEFIRKNYMTEGNQEYNIWYGKYLTSDYNSRKRHETEKAENRCVLKRDAGFTKCDGSYFLELYEKKLQEKKSKNISDEDNDGESNEDENILDPETINQFDQLKSSSFFSKSGNVKTNHYFCLHFARGICHYGSDCHYYHRIPCLEFDDHLQRIVLFDCFGRSKHKTHRDDMDGVGSFQSPCRTLFVAGFTLSLYRTNEKTAYENLEATLLRHFGEWGEVESVNIIPRLSIAFVRYRMTPSAEFAKEAMQGQSLDHNETLTIRWAHDDPNPKARSAAQQADRDALIAMLVANKVIPSSAVLPDSSGSTAGWLDPSSVGFNYPIEYMNQYHDNTESEEQKLKRQKYEEEGVTPYPDNLDQYSAYFNIASSNISDDNTKSVQDVQGNALARLGLLESDNEEETNTVIKEDSIIKNDEKIKEKYTDENEENDEEDEGPAWIKVFDDKSGLYYFFNQYTGESTWTKPDEYIEEKL